jgi:hypothetical protein
MSISLAGYEFAGPYTATSALEERSGVYAILTPTTTNRYRVIDVGESATVKSRVENHDRKPCWLRHADSGGIRYAVYYTPGQPQASRQLIEQKIRQEYKPPCGER